MKYSKLILLITGIIIGFHNNIKAQAEIIGSVISNGCESVYGNNFKINGTLGQPIIGKINNSNNISYSGFFYLSNSTLITVVDELSIGSLPTAFSLEQNYPNPFNPSTTIKFSLPKQSFVTLKVYDILGKEMNELLNDELEPGEYKVNFDAEYLSSGIYLYQLNSKDFNQVRKMMLVR